MHQLHLRNFLLLLLCLFAQQGLAQNMETYVVIARPSHLIRMEPKQAASAIDQGSTSIPYGGTIQVSKQLLEADTLEGIAGHWRQVRNKEGAAGYMFDGYLVPRGAPLPTGDKYGFERHERKIAGLNQLLTKQAEALEKVEAMNQRLQWISGIGWSILLIGTLLGFYFLSKKLKSKKTTLIAKTDAGSEVDLDELAKELAPRINNVIDPKIKKISPNIIELIQIQLKAFKDQIGREYEKKSHVKTIKIKHEAPEVSVEEQAIGTDQSPSPDLSTKKFGFDEETALFSAYLHKGYQRRYLELPRNNLFFGRKATTEITENSVYELYVLEKEPTRALFRLIDEPEILDQALRFPHDYIYPVCEVYGSGNIQEAEQLEYSYGVVVKDDVNWRIIQKSKLRYFLAEQLEEEATAETAWQPVGEDTTQILYATAPQIDYFDLNKSSETFKPGQHVFKITITEQTRGTFELVNDLDSQTKAFHLPNKYLLPAFATLGQGSIYVAKRAEMVQTGEITLENGLWKITKKGIVQYFRD
ncbi:MAG: hypothetical protein Sapg2KO_45280 [Saprospiraceae bacterium]